MIGVGAATLIKLALSPTKLISGAPLLMFAVCPLSMLMARGISHRNRTGAVGATAQHGDSVSAATATSAEGPQLRELAEEVNRLRQNCTCATSRVPADRPMTLIDVERAAVRLRSARRQINELVAYLLERK